MTGQNIGNVNTPGYSRRVVPTSRRSLRRRAAASRSGRPSRWDATQLPSKGDFITQSSLMDYLS